MPSFRDLHGLPSPAAPPPSPPSLWVPPEGVEWVVDAAGGDPVRLRDDVKLRALIERLLGEAKLHPVAPALWHVFPGEAGVTGLVLLAESHVALHTFPEHGTLTLNLYCCRKRPCPEWDTLLRETMGVQTVQVRTLPRGLTEASTTAAVVPPLLSR